MDAFPFIAQLTFVVYALGETHVPYQSKNTTVFVENGKTIVLNCTCSRSNDNHFQGSWKGPNMSTSKEDNIPYAEGLDMNPELNISNIYIIGDHESGTCNLKITNFSKINEGSYECNYLLLDNLKIFEHTYTVSMKTSPMNLEIQSAAGSHTIHGVENVEMTLVCTVTRGQPAGVLTWSANETRLTEGREGQLDYIFIPNRYDHQKLFTCSVEHELLISPLTKSVNLDIKFKPYMVVLPLKPNFQREGTSTELCCKSKSNPSVEYATWKKFMTASLWRTNSIRNDTDNEDQMFCLSISSLYRNSTGVYTCSAENSLGKGNSSMHLTVLYPPTVTVTYKSVKQTIRLQCKPSGEPENYTFDEWEHRSEFNELIRRIKGTHKGILALGQSNSRHHEDDGVYVCRASNGIPNSNDTIYQEGQVVITSTASPVFVAENKPIQVGKFGRGVEIKVIIYDQLYNSTVLIRNNGTTLKVKPTIENITTHDTFYGVNVRVSGIQYTFQLHLTTTHDFTNYSVEACNDVGCNYFYVHVISPDFSYKSRKYCSSVWKIVGSLIGGFFILIICFNMYCLLKRKRFSRLVTEIPLEVQYDEIGIIHGNSAGIQVLLNSVQEVETSVDGPAIEETYPHSTSLEQNDSSDNSVQSLSTSLLSGDGYENPYQLIDPADIEIHPYSTVGSYLYQNTIIFPKQISSRNSNSFIPNDEKRNPWLVIYKKTCVNAWT